ncbi:MAG TPA: AAA family ATPase [Ktedonobacteraceae bacterium]|nr:AAA family ATPase [Ktedonobacteraceae bacterium]
MKIFVLGRPGSGKSTAARKVNYLLGQYGWSVRHVNDYEILYEMFLADTQHLRFRPTEHNGFDAIDLAVMDNVLEEVEKRARNNLLEVNAVTIEFARNDYRKALKQFTPAFLKSAYFLFLDADIETCLRRVHERVERPNSIDDHPSFSDDIFRQYYNRENREYMAHCLQREVGLCQKVKVINNTGAFGNFLSHLEQYVNEILKEEAYRQKRQVAPQKRQVLPQLMYKK